MNEKVKAHCVGQEYWFIQRSRCECGGKFATDTQAIAQGPGGPTDLIHSHCETCGRARTFIFDIASFHDAFGDAMRVAEYLSGRKGKQLDDQMKTRILQSMGAPMSKVITFLGQLAEAKDSLALEYLAEVVEQYKREASQ